MMSGQRLQFVMIAPFSIEMRSAGKPSFCHWAFWLSFVSKSSGSMPDVIGISLRTKSAIQKSFVDERYSHDALREAQKRRDAAREADREAFRAAVLDWRKKDGPLVVERFGQPVEKDK